MSLLRTSAAVASLRGELAPRVIDHRPFVVPSHAAAAAATTATTAITGPAASSAAAQSCRHAGESVEPGRFGSTVPTLPAAAARCAVRKPARVAS
jgi:hypothetical protein